MGAIAMMTKMQPDAAVLRMLLDTCKYSLVDIAKQYGVSKQAVYQWAVKYGIRTPTKRTRASVLYPRSPFRRGDKVISSDKGSVDLWSGKYKTGIVMASPTKSDTIAVRIDGQRSTAYYSTSFWTLIDRKELAA